MLYGPTTSVRSINDKVRVRTKLEVRLRKNHGGNNARARHKNFCTNKVYIVAAKITARKYSQAL